MGGLADGSLSGAELTKMAADSEQLEFSMYLKEICARRACAGAAYLDKKMPDWRAKIRISALRMEHQNLDIGGQLAGDYTAFYRTMGYSADEERDLGFAHSFREIGSGDGRDEYYKELTKAWSALLLEDSSPDLVGVQNPKYVKK